jgi:hypothetical protein
LRAKIYDPSLKKMDMHTTMVVDDKLPGVALIRKEGIKIK